MRSRSVRLRLTDERDLWDGLVRSSPGGLLFHEWGWLDLQEEVLGGTFERLVVLDADVPVGVFPVARRSPRSRSRMPVPFPFLGPLVPAAALGPTFEAFARRQLVRGPMVCHVDLGPLLSAGAHPHLRGSGIHLWEERTVVIDLTHMDPHDIECGFARMRRRNIRKATQSGGSVRVAEPGELTTMLPALLDEAYAGRGACNPYPTRIGRMVEQWALGREDVAVFVGLVDDEPAGIQVVLSGNGTALYWVGASWRRFRTVDVTALLYRRCLQWAVERGCTRFDLCGSVDAGVRDYKLTFGGVEESYLTVESSPLPTRVIEPARRLRSRLHH